MTRLIDEYLRSLARQEQRAGTTAVLHSLMGALRSDTSLDGYRNYLEQKYIGNDENLQVV